MLTQEEDQQLVERVQRGDRRAFDLLVLKYQHKILGLIVRFVHDTHEAQDVAQEAFIKAYRALGNFRGDSAFYTWLYRIAINTAKNYLVSAVDGRQTVMSVPRMRNFTMAIMASRISSHQSARCYEMKSRAPSTEPSSSCQKICVRR